MKNLVGVKLKDPTGGNYGVGGERCWRNPQCRRDYDVLPRSCFRKEVFTHPCPLLVGLWLPESPEVGATFRRNLS